MSLLDIFRVGTIKADLAQARKEGEALRATLSETEHMEYYTLKQVIAEDGNAATAALGRSARPV
jgi:hypothetical protein